MPRPRTRVEFFSILKFQCHSRHEQLNFFPVFCPEAAVLSRSLPRYCLPIREIEKGRTLAHHPLIARSPLGSNVRTDDIVNLEPTKLKFKDAAFSLIEVTVSMAIVSILFVSLYGGIASGFALVSLARENLRANQVIVEKMETLRLYSWDQVNSNGYIPPTFTAPFFPSVITNLVENSNGTQSTTTTSFGDGGIVYHGTVTITNAPVAAEYADSMKMVTVTLTWTNGAVARNRQLQTLVSRNGVQNYVYY